MLVAPLWGTLVFCVKVLEGPGAQWGVPGLPRWWPRREQPVLSHSVCEGRVSGLPWQQLRASLSVWPLTAVAPDWLHSPSPSPGLSGSCIISSSPPHPLGRWCKGSAGLGSLDSACWLACFTCGWGGHLQEISSPTLVWAVCHSRSGCKENSA